MVVMILQNAPQRIRGELTRWMIEPQAGVFVGTMSAMVRDLLWEKVCQAMGDKGCLMVHSSNNEQGFLAFAHGDTRRRIVDYDGLQLVSTFRASDPTSPIPGKENAGPEPSSTKESSQTGQT